MAEVNFKGLDELTLSLEQVAELPDEVIDEMLEAAADVTVPAQRAEAMKLGKLGGYRNDGQRVDYSTGATARSIKKGRVKVKNGQRFLYITPVGSRRESPGAKPVRNAEIAFLNEFGTKTIHARNFIRTANEKCAEAATAAQMAVYNKFLESKNL